MDNLTLTGVKEEVDWGMLEGSPSPVFGEDDFLMDLALDDPFIFDDGGLSGLSPIPQLFPEVENLYVEGIKQEVKDIMFVDYEIAWQQEKESEAVELKHQPSTPITSTEVWDGKRVSKMTAKDRSGIAEMTPPKPRVARKGKSGGGIIRRKRREKGDSIDPKELFEVKPLRKMGPRKAVPEEEKDSEYRLKRIQNTEASRKCRQRNKRIDEERVDGIQKRTKWQVKLIEKKKDLERENAVQMNLLMELSTGPEETAVLKEIFKNLSTGSEKTAVLMERFKNLITGPKEKQPKKKKGRRS